MKLSKDPRGHATRAFCLAALSLAALIAFANLPRPSANLAAPTDLPSLSPSTLNATTPSVRAPWAWPSPARVTPTLLAPFILQLEEEGLMSAEYYKDNAEDFECEDCDLYFLEHYLLPLLPGCRDGAGPGEAPPQRTALIADPDPKESAFLEEFVQFHCPGIRAVHQGTPEARAAAAGVGALAVAVVERQAAGGVPHDLPVPKQPETLPLVVYRTAAPAEGDGGGGGGGAIPEAAAQLAAAGYQLFLIAYDGILRVDPAFFEGGELPLGQEGQRRAPTVVGVLTRPKHEISSAEAIAARRRAVN